MTVYVALWCQGADSEILGVYSEALLAHARCHAEIADRATPDGTAVVQEHEIDG